MMRHSEPPLFWSAGRSSRPPLQFLPPALRCLFWRLDFCFFLILLMVGSAVLLVVFPPSISCRLLLIAGFLCRTRLCVGVFLLFRG
jgi:hypothetical protein